MLLVQLHVMPAQRKSAEAKSQITTCRLASPLLDDGHTQ